MGQRRGERGAERVVQRWLREFVGQCAEVRVAVARQVVAQGGGPRRAVLRHGVRIEDDRDRQTVDGPHLRDGNEVRGLVGRVQRGNQVGPDQAAHEGERDQRRDHERGRARQARRRPGQGGVLAASWRIVPLSRRARRLTRKLQWDDAPALSGRPCARRPTRPRPAAAAPARAGRATARLLAAILLVALGFRFVGPRLGRGPAPERGRGPGGQDHDADRDPARGEPGRAARPADLAPEPAARRRLLGLRRAAAVPGQAHGRGPRRAHGRPHLDRL